jgi:diguanylate cyclase
MLPDILKSYRLQARIVVVYLGLLVVIQAVSYWFIQDSVNLNARSAIRTELSQEENVFLRLVELNNDNLQRVAHAARNDPGWLVMPEEDVDRPMQALLGRYARMLHQGVAMHVNLSGRVHASQGGHDSAFATSFQHQIRLAQTVGIERKQVIAIHGKPYQMVVQPVQQGETQTGWVGIAAPIDTTLLGEMKSLSGLDVAILQRDPRGEWQMLQGTQDAGLWNDIAASWQTTVGPVDGTDGSLVISGDEYCAHPIVLPAGQGQPQLTALLLGSVDRALLPFQPLKYKLLLLSALGLVVFGVGGYITARRITSPLRMLTGSARRLELGDYGAEVRVSTKDEVGELAHSFEAMRQAIQMRESEIRRLAYHDALTDLPNREQFRHDLRQAILRANQESSSCAIMLLDIDRFKHINDVLGHRFGDRLLRALATRLRDEALEPNDILARLSGDEFGILLHKTDAQAARLVAERVQKSLDRPITLDDHTVDLGAGVGIATCPANGLEADALLSRAEVAMYAAKTQKSGTVVYHPGLDSSSEESLTLLSELRYAVDHHQLRLYLQPKVHALTGRIIGGEALVRWEHPERGLVPPMRFIPFAEQAGFIRVLTTWVLEESAKLSKQMSAEGLDMKLSVNLSTRDLMDQDLPSRMSLLAQKYGIQPAKLCLEITESAIMDDPQRALQTLERLSLLGFSLSIDDFGTGYSSLAYLKRLPVNELKIDKSFVMNMESDIQDAQIVRSTVELAHNLGLNVVAEGVESAKCWKLLSELKCDEIQGFFIARPMPADDFVVWARNWVAPDTSAEQLETAFTELI